MDWLLYPLTGIAALVLAVQLLARWQARRQLGQRAPDTRAIDGVAAGSPRRLYYFFAPHCGPCRAMTPLVERLQAAREPLVSVDLSRLPDLGSAFGIAATPSFVLVEADMIREVRLGAQSEGQLRALLAGAQR